MAGGKESARQKMINIMYLVLLAMLALNVSDTILNAFKILNDSLTISKTNVANGITQLFTTFENTKLKEEKARAQPIYDKAKEAQAIAEELITYIDKLKADFTKAGNGISPETGDLVERSNLDIAPGIMINKKEGEKLKSKINDTRKRLLNLLDEKDRASIALALEANDPEKAIEGKKDWEEVNFGEGTPLTAAMTILTKIQTDTKNAESDIVKKIFGKMDIAVVNLDQFSAVAVAPTSYIIAGQPYTAEVFLTAYDSKSNPAIQIGGSSIPVSNGKGSYSVGTSKEGIFSWTGTIRVKQTDGTVKTYTTPEQKYQVARPSAVVSPDKMNVFYIGVPNPVSISAPGIPKENLRVTMSGGQISGSNGKYTVSVSSSGYSKVNVSAEIGGKVQLIGSSDFRVKRIPDPKAKFAGKTGGAMSSVIIKSQNAIFAILDGFDFDAKFNVTRFTMVIAKPRQDVIILTGQGNSFNAAMKAAVSSVTPGSRVIFDNIVAVGPDGTQRQLDPIVLTAN
ncbi:MAG: gliding motility-associated protein GldM [Sphingobacteriales bacterium]|nr:gliding motility-associated protein GldM [Sphingobacteriales bacterium]